MHVKFIFTRFVCCGQITAFTFFKSRWFETVNRFGHTELLPGSIFSYVHYFLFTGEVIYCLIVKTYFKRLSLCGYQFPILLLPVYLIVTRTSSCHTFIEAKANGGSTQLSSPSYSPFIVSFRRVGGNLVMKLTHKGDRERPSKSLGLENTFTNLGVTGRSPTVCLHSKSSETPLQH